MNKFKPRSFGKVIQKLFKGSGNAISSRGVDDKLKNLDIKVTGSVTANPTIINSSMSLTPKRGMSIIIGTDNVELTLLNGPYDSFPLPILAKANCTISYTGPDGPATDVCEDGDYFIYVWQGSYWIPRQATSITGIDDNGQPFAFNIDAMVHYDGLINISGKDANGNPFDYGVGRLVTNADEDNIVTGVEIKTSKTYNGKPVYFTIKQETTGTTANATTDVALLGSDVDKVIVTGGTIYGNNDADRYPLNNFISSSDYSSCWTPVVGGVIYVRVRAANSNRLGARVEVWAYYTKTTD